MLTALHSRKKLQLVLGLLAGICFGVLLQKGGVTNYDVIIGQLLFEDMTVVKIMLTAMVVGMVGIHILKALNLAEITNRTGSLGSNVLGGLMFGVGFAVLGYCPGTVMGAVGQGNVDALLGGVVGILIGAGLLATLYPRLEYSIIKRGRFPAKSLPELFRVNAWVIIVPVVTGAVALLWWLSAAGY
jgi:hypothetical protein